MSQVDKAQLKQIVAEAKQEQKKADIPRDLLLINRCRNLRGKRMLTGQEYVALGQGSGQRGIAMTVTREQKEVLYFLTQRFGLPKDWAGTAVAAQCGIGATAIFSADVEDDEVESTTEAPVAEAPATAVA